MRRERGPNSCAASSSTASEFRSIFKPGLCATVRRPQVVSRTRWLVTADLQICHQSSILSANFSRPCCARQAHGKGNQAVQERMVEIDVRTQDQVKLIKLRGKLHLGPALDRTNETIKDLLNTGEARLVLDLEEVPMIDS